jgi:hypothetical protein
MKPIFTVALVALPLLGNTQAIVSDSVILGPSYANRAFYSLENSTVGTMPSTGWDLQLASHSVMSSTIRLNAGNGAAAWQYMAGDTANWASLDTAGMGASNGWMRIHDDINAYDPGAFEVNATGFPNYGWGNYNTISHDVVGEKLFVVKTTTGTFKKMWIVALHANTQTFELKVADLDGSNETTIDVVRAGQTGKNFLYLNLNTGAVTNPEPEKTTYELVFERYEASLSPGVYYPVVGVRPAVGIQNARVANVHVDDVTASSGTLSDDLVAIGHDWKAFANGSWQLADSMSFLIETRSGALYQIWFTGFVGQSGGKFFFNKRLLATASIENNNALAAEVYPNPVSDILYVKTQIQTPATLLLTDMQGRVWLSQTMENGTSSIPVNQLGLSNGAYVVRVISEGKVFTSTVIIR